MQQWLAIFCCCTSTPSELFPQMNFCYFSRYQTRNSFGGDVQLVSTFLSHKGTWSFHIFEQNNNSNSNFSPVSDTMLFLLILKEPQYVTAGSTVACHFWRKCTPKKVWYEWCMSRPAPVPLHNPGGRSYVIGLWSNRAVYLPVRCFPVCAQFSV